MLSSPTATGATGGQTLPIKAPQAPSVVSDDTLTVASGGSQPAPPGIKAPVEDLFDGDFEMTPNTFVASLDAIANCPWLPSPSSSMPPRVSSLPTPIAMSSLPMPPPATGAPATATTTTTTAGVPPLPPSGPGFTTAAATAAGALAAMEAPQVCTDIMSGPSVVVRPVEIPVEDRPRRNSRTLKRLHSAETSTPAAVRPAEVDLGRQWFGQARMGARGVGVAAPAVGAAPTLASPPTLTSSDDDVSPAAAGKAKARPPAPGRKQKPQYRGVSFVAKRRQWQAQVTVSDKLHCGNFETEEAAAHAVTFAKNRLRKMGFTVKLADNDVEPRLDAATRASTEQHVNRVVANFSSKWQSQLEADMAPPSAKRVRTDDGPGDTLAAANSRNVTVLAPADDGHLRGHALALANALVANKDRVVLASRDDTKSSWMAASVGGVAAGGGSLDTRGLVGLLKASDLVIPVIDPRSSHFKDLVKGLADSARRC